MYVRVATFEGAEGDWDERIADVRNRMRSRGEGTPMADSLGKVKRAMMLVDRVNGRGASVIFCDTESDLQGVDEAMNQMSPTDGGGKRAGVDSYEVAVDEEFS